MKQNELISVVVPVYQVAEYLPRCLESILCQTYTNLEIILVDDGSTDGSGEICDAFARKDPRIKVIHKRNGGLVSARKAAMGVATGDLLAYVDSDDWIDPDMYALMYRNMEESSAEIIVTGHTEEFGTRSVTWLNKIPSGVYRGSALVDRVFANMLYDPDIRRWALSPACWDKLFRRESVEQFQMRVDERIWDGEDHAFIYPALLHSKTVSVMGIAPYHYRFRDDSISQAFDARAFERLGYLYAGLRRDYMLSGHWGILEKQLGYQMRWFLLKHMETELGVDVYEEGEAVRPYIFPFGKIPAHSRIVLYGAGNVGQLYHRQILSTQYCEVLAVVSGDYKERGAGILPPEKLRELDPDYVVIAVESGEAAASIRAKTRSMGIEEGRILWVPPGMGKSRL